MGTRGSGKSTVFHALTGLKPLEGQGDSKNRGRPGQIRIPDPRNDFLERCYGSKKKVSVELTVMDFAPNPKDQKAGAALDPTLLPLLRDLDALLLVVPQFHGNSPDVADAVDKLESELVFADFEQIERRLERLKKEKGANDLEKVTLEKCLARLETGAPLRTLELSPQETAQISNFCFLSQQPALVVINCEQEHYADEVGANVREKLASRGLYLFKLPAVFEAELWELGESERAEMLREANLDAPARDRLVRALYDHLGLITFYTAGEPESHAWSLRKGASALEAAGRIHSDIAKGFIRAEVVSYEDFAELQSDAKVKAAGKLRLEGRDYVMQDGDIIH